MTKTSPTVKSVLPVRGLRLGFVPLTDCAPLVVAQECGLFRKYGLRVALSRELGWATVRDKIIHRELDAAHAVAGMPFAATLGLGSVRCDCVSALVLNLHGDAITLSTDLWRRGVRDGAGLRGEILRCRGQKRFTFGVVFPFSAQHFLLRGWLSASGIDPDREVQIVVVPPPQMAVNLKAGHLDGFCAGEPWNSVAAQARAGWCVAASAELDFGHPEKVLMVRQDFAERREEEHLALLAALLEACAFCEAPENREEVIGLLARPEYLGVPAAALRPGFEGRLSPGGDPGRIVSEFNVFHGGDANEPSGAKAAWVLRHLRSLRTAQSADTTALNPGLGSRVFRSDVFARALQLKHSFSSDHEDHINYDKELSIV